MTPFCKSFALCDSNGFDAVTWSRRSQPGFVDIRSVSTRGDPNEVRDGWLNRIVVDSGKDVTGMGRRDADSSVMIPSLILR